MRLSEYELMYQLEDRLWWYRGMRAITTAMLDRYYPRPGRLRILDAGCGTGRIKISLRNTPRRQAELWARL